MGGGVAEIANAVRRSHGSVGMTSGRNRSWQVERNCSVALVGTVRIKQMGLAAEGPVAVCVLLDELIDDGAGCAFIETLPNKHLDDERPKGFQRIVAPLRHHARNRHEQCRAGHIVSSGALGLSVGITQLLLSLALFAVTDLLGLCWHALFPVRSPATDARPSSLRQRRLHGIGNPGL
ncbi:hypothetical protein AGR7B_Lc100007 [Agrobacterium deltaense RV3]|nr:hypothetical protein AGR7B_Lc100007 [Agrobacterium deltaense RV3]